MGKSQRTKGHNWEREVASKLRCIFPTAKRGYQTRGGTAEAPDVDGTPYFIECKIGSRPNIPAAMAQATEAKIKSDDSRPVVAVTKRDHRPALATMYLGDFIALLIQLDKYNGKEGP